MPGAGELAAQTPGALNSLIVARLDHLPQDLRQTLKMLAVLGPSFPASLLGPFCDLSGEQADAQIESLLDRQFLVPSSQSPEQSYSFRHALIQEALYDTMLRSDRAKLHEKAGEAIEGGDGGGQQIRMARVGTGDAGAECGPRGHSRHRAEQGEGIPALGILVDPDGVDAARVRRLRHRQSAGSGAAGRVPCPGVMAEIEGEAHGTRSGVVGITPPRGSRG